MTALSAKWMTKPEMHRGAVKAEQRCWHGRMLCHFLSWCFLSPDANHLFATITHGRSDILTALIPLVLLSNRMTLAALNIISPETESTIRITLPHESLFHASLWLFPSSQSSGYASKKDTDHSNYWTLHTRRHILTWHKFCKRCHTTRHKANTRFNRMKQFAFAALIAFAPFSLSRTAPGTYLTLSHIPYIPQAPRWRHTLTEQLKLHYRHKRAAKRRSHCKLTSYGLSPR